MTKSTAISGESPVLPMMNGTMEAKEIANHTNGNLVVRNILRRKEGEEFGPDTLVLPGGSNPVGPESHIRSFLRHTPGVKT